MVHIPFSRSILTTIRLKQELKGFAKSGWQFSEERLNMIKREGADWQKHYAPIDVRGKTVIDAGAGEGETAKFYIEQGAKRVYCIEPDRNRFKLLSLNALAHRQIVPMNTCFDVSHLQLEHDLLKVDIEGYEECLLSVDLPKPAVLEIHGLQLKDRFETHGYRLERHALADWWTCYGYWRC